MSEEWSGLSGEASRKRTTSEVSSSAEADAKRMRSSRSPNSESDSAQTREESPKRSGPAQSTSQASPDDNSVDLKRKSEERRLMALISHFSSDHLNRFEMYRRAALPKAGVRRLMQSAVDTSIPQNAVIAMCGIAKVFVGEIIEEGKSWAWAPMIDSWRELKENSFKVWTSACQVTQRLQYELKFTTKHSLRYTQCKEFIKDSLFSSLKPKGKDRCTSTHPDVFFLTFLFTRLLCEQGNCWVIFSKTGFKDMR